MNISFFGVRDSEYPLLTSSLVSQIPNAHVRVHREHLTPDIKLENFDDEVISVFVDCIVSKEVIGRFPNLKLIVARSTGYDNIDSAECQKRNIVVCTVPSYGEHTVAEFTFALILALSRKVFDCVARVKSTHDFTKDGLTGFDLCGKTLGIIGTGKIGQHVARMAQGFEMRVVAYDTFPRNELALQLGFTYVPLDELLARSDVVTLHVPHIPETHHLMNAENFTRLKAGAYIINTSRGGVLDTIALKAGLMSGHVGGAALDVLEEESGTIDQELLNIPNLLITPHTAFNSREAIGRILATTIENIIAFQKGTPQNTVH